MTENQPTPTPANATETVREAAQDVLDEYERRSVRQTIDTTSLPYYCQKLREAMKSPALSAPASPAPVANLDGLREAVAMARRFHDAYERLAPQFGYETRTDTRQFDPASKNGRLMIAVCALLASPAPRPDAAAPSAADAGVVGELREEVTAFLATCEGRVPADSSDSLSIEAVWVHRLRNVLASPARSW